MYVLMCVCVCVCVATLLVLIDAAVNHRVVFLPAVTLPDSRYTQTQTTHTDSLNEHLLLTAAIYRPGDVLTRLTAIDWHQPAVPVSYRVIHDTEQSRAFDISQWSGLMTLTSNKSLLTSLLSHVTSVNVTVQAAINDSLSGHVVTASTVVRLQLVDAARCWSGSNVGGPVWDCVHQHVTVTENAPAATSLARLTARYGDDVVRYYIVSGDAQHVFSLDSTTVRRYCVTICLSVCLSVCLTVCLCEYVCVFC